MKVKSKTSECQKITLKIILLKMIIWYYHVNDNTKPPFKNEIFQQACFDRIYNSNMNFLKCIVLYDSALYEFF